VPELATIEDTSPGALDALLAAAVAASDPYGALGAPERARCLEAVAASLEAAEAELVELAGEETHLSHERLSGELRRTTFQLRLFAEVVRRGEYLEATIDHADPSWPPAPRPDLRRVLVPLGPALVFAASNFPFAFSVAGGDTASALAAGCPVILKASPGHPRLSARTGQLVAEALEAAGAPAGTFGVIFGQEAGAAAIVDARVRVAAFTGSLAGGRALFDLATSRADPIPFYGELGSLNPVFVTAAAARRRRDEIVRGFVSSFTLGAGQFCTKPGLLFVPAGAGFEAAAAELASGQAGAELLNDRLAEGYRRSLEALARRPGVDVVLAGSPDERRVTPTLLATDLANVVRDAEHLLVECFGPAALIVAHDDDDALVEVASRLPGQLSAAVHGEETGDPTAARLVAMLAKVAGRVVWNGWPTGVAVTWATHHGGPYPATTSPSHTSVGTAAIERFLRPVAFQDVPDALLPPALQEANPLGIPRRVDGVAGR